MSALVLDAGALIAYERGDRKTAQRLRTAELEGSEVVTSAIVVAQVWRGGRGQQVLLARLLSIIDVRPIDAELGRRAGELLGRSGTDDPIDAAVVLLAQDRDRILTSDPDDIQRLAEAAGRRPVVVPC